MKTTLSKDHIHTAIRALRLLRDMHADAVRKASAVEVDRVVANLQAADAALAAFEAVLA